MAMHRDSFVVAVKTADGQVLREDNSGNIPIVYLPFDSDYKLLLKNLHKRRAVVTIMIDGQDIAAGHRFVVEPGVDYEIERFMLDGNYEAGRKLRFVKADDKRVESPDFGGNGFIKVTWQFEKEVKAELTHTTTIIHEHHYDYGWYRPIWVKPVRYTPYEPYWGGDSHIYCSSNAAGSSLKDFSAQNCSLNTAMGEVKTGGEVKIKELAAAQDQRGATVEGEASAQQFSVTAIRELETATHEITFQILAPPARAGKEAKAVTVQDTKNRYCPTCGQKMPYNARFCSACGQQL